MNGQSLKERIERSGLSQEEFAEKINVPGSTLRSWVRTNAVNKDQVEVIASLLGTTRQELEDSGIRINKARRRLDTLPQEDTSSKPLLKVIKESKEELGARETSKLFEHYAYLYHRWKAVPTKLRPLLLEALKQG